MSTRSVIARETKSGFAGRYHHWDGYPEGLGQALFKLFNGHFKQHLGAMLKVLLDDHPGGWSTIVNADFCLEPGYTDRDDYDCVICGNPKWAHYQQYYKSHDLPEPPCFASGSYLVFDHSPKAPELPKRPECYCHGCRKEKPSSLTHKTASGSGCEWAYVFSVRDSLPTMTVYSAYHRDGNKSIGYFGQGDPKAIWRLCALITLTDPEPDWKTITEDGEVIQRPVINFV